MKLRGLVLVAALAVLLLPQAAHAITVYDLTVPNSNLSGLTKPYPTPFGSVTVTLESPTTASISVVVASDYKLVGNQGGFALNVNADRFTYANITYGPTTQPNLVGWGGNKQMDGLGYFNAVFDGPQFGAKGKNNKPIIIQDLAFNLINTSGKSWANSDVVLLANSNAMVAVAHVGVIRTTNNGLTGFVGADPPVNPPAHAPIPSTVLLLGSGLLALGLRWRLRKR